MDFSLLRKLYEKKPIKFDEIKGITIQDCLVMMNFLSQDMTLLPILKKALAYLFSVDPTYFYIYLYCQIPKKTKAPYLKYPKTSEKKEDVLLKKMKLIYGWGDRELRDNEKILSKLIDMDRGFFEERFGVEPKKKK